MMPSPFCRADDAPGEETRPMGEPPVADRVSSPGAAVDRFRKCGLREYRLLLPGADGPMVTRLTCPSENPSRHQRRSGFTLIELVVSTALMALILTAAYACLSAGVAGQKLVEPRADVFQNARVALSLLSADLRCACPLPKGAPFLGFRRLLGEVSADNLDFATHNYTPRKPGEGDFCEESIFLEKDPGTGRFTLWRRRNPTMAFDPLSGGNREEMATGVAGLRLEYYDGLNWYDSWGDPNPGSARSEMASERPNSVGLPEAVRITLSFDSIPRPVPASGQGQSPTEPPLVFQTIARLNVSSPDSSESPTGAGGSTESGNPPTKPAEGGK